MPDLEMQWLDPADDAQLEAFFEVSRRAELEDGRPWNSFWSFPEMAEMLRDQLDDSLSEALLARAGDTVVGAGLVMYSALANLDKVNVVVSVDPAHRRRGVGTAVLEAVVARARELGRPEVLGMTAYRFDERETSGTRRFAERHGFRLANTEVLRILPLPVADAQLDELAAESAPHHAAYRIETHVDGLPDRYLESYAHAHSQLSLDAPTGELDFEEERLTAEIAAQRLERSRRMGRRTFYSVAVVGADEVVAYSDLIVQPVGTQAHQMGTLVRRDHRGHRLGTAVKVANLRALQQDRPDVTEVHTQNAEDNAWMVDINVRLGFEPVAVAPEFVRRLHAG